MLQPESLSHVDEAVWRGLFDVMQRQPDQALAHLESLALPPNACGLHGASIDTVLDLAISAKCEPVVLQQLKQDPRMTAKANRLLVECLWSPAAVTYLLDHGHSIEELRSAYTGALAINLKRAPLATLDVLLANGFDINAAVESIGYDHELTSAPLLVAAAQLLQAPRVRYCLEQGARVDERGFGGRWTFLQAAVTQHRDRADASFDGPEFVAMFTEVVQVASSLNVDMNLRDHHGNTALHLAAQRGYANKARILIEHGADPVATNAEGHSPAVVARKARKPALVALLKACEARSAMARMLAAPAP